MIDKSAGLHSYFRECRINAGLTQSQLAKKLGFKSAQFVSNVERGAGFYSETAMVKVIRFTKADRKVVYNAMVNEATRHYRKLLRVRD